MQGSAVGRKAAPPGRNGFEYTEWFVRQVNEGDADLKAGRVMSTEEVLSVIEKQRALRDRKSSAAA